jgi:hypothetical protein
LFLIAAGTTMLRPAKFAIKATTRNGALRTCAENPKRAAIEAGH